MILAITRRNVLLYFRDPLRVFLSLLASLILFLLYTLFLGDLQSGIIRDTVPGLEPASVDAFVDTWMFGGIIAITMITAPLGALSSFAEDIESARFRDLLVSPIPRTRIVLGYLLSTWVIGALVTAVIFVIAWLYLGAVSGVWLDGLVILRSVGWAALSVAAFGALWAFVVSFLRSAGAFAGLSTTIGVLSGFVAGAFIAPGLFPNAVRDAISALPFAQASMLVRAEFTAETLPEVAGGHQPAIDELGYFYGTRLSVGTWDVSTWAATAILAGMVVVFAGLAAWRIRRVIR